MNLIQRLMGRRQFLIATGLASGCALTSKKLIDFQANEAMAAEKAAAAAIKTAGNKCPHLLSPLRIRNVLLKNRIMHTASPPHCMQGPENFPADAFRNHYSNMAKNAAIVTVDMAFGTYPKTYADSSLLDAGTDHHSDHTWEDIPPVRNYLYRMIDDIHSEGALVRYIGQTGGGGGTAGSGGAGGTASGNTAAGTAAGAAGMPGGGAAPGATGTQGQGSAPGGAPGGGAAPGGTGTQGQGSAPGQASGGAGMPGGGPGGPQGQQASQSVEDIVKEAKKVEDMGFDVMTLNTSNLEAVKAVRAATNLILMGSLRVGGGGMGGNVSTLHQWDYEGSHLDWVFGSNSPGVTNSNKPTDAELEQAVEQAKKLVGLVDYVWIRDGRHEHPNSWTQDKARPFNLYYAEAIKKAGVDIIVCPSAGFHDPIQNDEFIAKGLTDMVGMTTPFFADAELIKKVSEGRAEDIIRCLQCHDCHGISRKTGPWYDTCAANPKWATPDYKLRNIPAPTTVKKVAVIGGGPAGMKAALTASERGHKVTLFEKGDSLGGLLQFTEHTQWKWTYKDFKDYLILQVKKAGIDVQLNTTATPEMVKSKGYDTVLVATGSEPVLSKMKGAENVFNILTAYSNKKALGKRVVMIGAGRIGTECAIGMAKDGHKVTILCAGKDLIELEVIGSHNMMNQIAILQNHPDLDFVTQANVKGITGGKVTYTDSTGSEKSIDADSIVIYAGLKPRMDEAERFIGSADQVLFMGDCTGRNGTIQKALRSAFFVASQV